MYIYIHTYIHIYIYVHSKAQVFRSVGASEPLRLPQRLWYIRDSTGLALGGLIAFFRWGGEGGGGGCLGFRVEGLGLVNPKGPILPIGAHVTLASGALIVEVRGF